MNDNRPVTQVSYDEQTGKIVFDPPIEDENEIIDLTIFGEPVRLTRKAANALKELMER